MFAYGRLLQRLFAFRTISSLYLNIYSAADRGAEYCDERVLCAFVCPRSYLRNYTSDLYNYFFLRVSYKPRLLAVAAQLKRNAPAALGLVKNCAQ